jgi:hypothetical protein
MAFFGITALGPPNMFDLYRFGEVWFDYVIDVHLNMYRIYALVQF